MERYLLQHFTQGIGEDFLPVEEDLHHSFLPSLFRVATDEVPDKRVTRIPAKQAGLAIPNPNLSASENRTAYCVVTEHRVAALWGKT